VCVKASKGDGNKSGDGGKGGEVIYIGDRIGSEESKTE